jgi:hypothetical protein
MFKYKDTYAGEVLVAKEGRYVVGAIGEHAVTMPLVDSVIERINPMRSLE